MIIRYVAFLRGVSPLNAKMPELKHCFEDAGFTHVKTVLSSGNIVFDAPARDETGLARRAEGSMTRHLSRAFYTIVRPAADLTALIETDPWEALDVPAGAKRFVTFVGEPQAANRALPIQNDESNMLAWFANDLLWAAIDPSHSSRLLSRIEKVFNGKVTTRTWETVKNAQSPETTLAFGSVNCGAIIILP